MLSFTMPNNVIVSVHYQYSKAQILLVIYPAQVILIKHVVDLSQQVPMRPESFVSKNYALPIIIWII